MPEAVPAPDVDGTEPQIVIDLSHEEAGETSEEGALRSVAPKNRSKKRASDVLEDGATSNGEAAPLNSWGANRPVRGTRKEVSYNVTKYYEGLVVDELVAGSEAGKGGARSSKKRRSSSLVQPRRKSQNRSKSKRAHDDQTRSDEADMSSEVAIEAQEDQLGVKESPACRERPSNKESLVVHTTSPNRAPSPGGNEGITSYDSLVDSRKSEGMNSNDSALTSGRSEGIVFMEELFDPDDLSEVDDEWEATDSRSRAKRTRKPQSRSVEKKRQDGRTAYTVTKQALNILLEQGKTKLSKSGGIQYVRQWKGCQSHYGHVQQCRHCVSRVAGDSCRFKDMRALPITEDEFGIEIISSWVLPPIYVGNSDMIEEPNLPDHYDLNRPVDEVARRDIMTTAAISLIGVFQEGIEHAQKTDCIRRSRELQIRALCDHCSTGLFVASYMCKRCGSEYCLACKERMGRLTKKEQQHTQLCICVQSMIPETHTAGLRPNQHSLSMLVPVSRFSLDELRNEVAIMRRFKDEHGASVATSKIQTDASAQDDDVVSADKTELPLPEQIDIASLPSHKLTMHCKKDMDESRFLATWSQGEPLVVNDVVTQNVWDPSAFIKKYGHSECVIVRCDVLPRYHLPSERVKKNLPQLEKLVNVQDFFQTFGKPKDERREMFGEGIWKLKDWPPAAEFRTSFPDIYEDFQNVVPMPDYTRRDGCRNISALFPKNANGPDLGPKMYNAWPGEHSKGKKGTTCLHMDVADAVNILLHAEDLEDAQEKAAQWDIFRAEDADLIRQYLQEREPAACKGGDPIHTQSFYLDDDALVELYRQKGVYSWRILQRAGQAVFIPAGCAHQVCNLTDCIKVAVDFISPQNVARCFQLVEQFRGMSIEGKRSWKEDVLQLKAQLWYAWSTCRQLPPAPSEAEHGKGVERRQDEERAALSLKLERASRRRKASAKVSLPRALGEPGEEPGELQEMKREEDETAPVEEQAGKKRAKKQVRPKGKLTVKKTKKDTLQDDEEVELPAQKSSDGVVDGGTSIPANAKHLNDAEVPRRRQYKEVAIETDPDLVVVHRSQLHELASSVSSRSDSTKDSRDDATTATSAEESEEKQTILPFKSDPRSDGSATSSSFDTVFRTPSPRATYT